jgi:hypothetical protein
MPDKNGRATPEEREALERRLREIHEREEAARYTPSEIYKNAPAPSTQTRPEIRRTPPS